MLCWVWTTEKGGSPQAKAGRKYGGQPTVDERSCRENFIFAKPISRNQLNEKCVLVAHFLFNLLLDLNHEESGSTAGERRMEYAGEQSEWAKVTK